MEKFPHHPDIRYNLGLVYSDQGKLDAAIECLTKTTSIQRERPHAWVALVGAYYRHKDLEIARFAAEEALQLDGADLYTLRTVGALYGQSGDYKRSITLLKKAQQINANDPTTLLVLAQSLLEGEEPDKRAAEQYLKRVIKIAPGTPFAEQAEIIQTKIAYQHFSEGGDVKRKSAVMYCVWALEKFDAMAEREVAGVATELSTLGQSGLDVHDPDKLYEVRSIPERYSGLQIVCTLHVAVQHLVPGQDSGFDLSAEYTDALGIFDPDKFAPS